MDFIVAKYFLCNPESAESKIQPYGYFKDCELMIHQAAGFGHGSVEIFMLLSNHLTNKNPPPANCTGWTPLHMAACKGHLKICEFIMDSLVNKNPANVINFTPLHVAASHGHTDICALILENVQNKMPVTQDGKTPAMLAIESNHCELGQFLKNAGKAKSSEHLATQLVRDEKQRKLNESQ